MKKSECKQAFPTLYSKWLRDSGNSATPPGELSFYEFFSWLQQNHREYTRFSTNISVEYDLENWFDIETKQTWRN